MEEKASGDMDLELRKADRWGRKERNRGKEIERRNAFNRLIKGSRLGKKGSEARRGMMGLLN